jgi:hypothetical protein
MYTCRIECGNTKAISDLDKSLKPFHRVKTLFVEIITTLKNKCLSVPYKHSREHNFMFSEGIKLMLVYKFLDYNTNNKCQSDILFSCHLFL